MKHNAVHHEGLLQADAKYVKPMNEAVKQNLVRKIGDTKWTKDSNCCIA